MNVHLPATRHRTPVVVALGAAQIVAWASSYYLVAILADPMSQALQLDTTTVFAAFSAALLVSAIVGPRVGRTIDQFGGRGVLMVSSALFVIGLVVLGVAASAWMIWLGWLVLGLAMGLGLYDAAFATLGRLYGAEARNAITGITLIAGFASTVGWPLTAWVEAGFGWRNACFLWAGINLVVALPLYYFLPRAPRDATVPDAGDKNVTLGASPVVIDRNMVLLAIAFAAGWLVSTGMAAHLPRVLEAAGASTAVAIGASALLGPAQVAARLADFSLLKRFHPLFASRLAMLAHPIGAAALLIFGAPLAVLFTLLHGGGNGILTIAKGAVPLAIYGSKHYGYRLGLIGAPARIGQAVAPLLFGWMIAVWGAGVLFASSALCLVAFVALLAVRSSVHPVGRM